MATACVRGGPSEVGVTAVAVALARISPWVPRARRRRGPEKREDGQETVTVQFAPGSASTAMT